MSSGCGEQGSARLDGLLQTALRNRAGGIVPVRSSDAVEAGCLGGVGKGADGSRLPWAGRGEAARSRPLWQPHNTSPESNAAELLGRRIDPANRRHH